jgi:hypothetical protein
LTRRGRLVNEHHPINVGSAAMIVVIAAIVPRILMVVAMVIAIVVTLMVTRPRDDAGG